MGALSRHGVRRPLTAMQALMEAPPHHEVDMSTEEGLPLREILADAIDTVLSPRERWCFEALVIERQSVRQLGRQLNISKTHVCRVRDQAIQKLALNLQDHPIVKGMLT